jgi:signal transduction histidine kinase/ActR/RegA family two-component response regulator
MNTPILKLKIHFEQDVVMARQRTWQIAKLLGFATQDQTRVATAVSEIARNAFQYAGGGTVEFSLCGEFAQTFQICIRDRGPGITNLQHILQGKYVSATGMGLGIIGAKRLMDSFEITSTPGEGTTVLLAKTLPQRIPFITAKKLAEIADELAQQPPQNPLEEVQRQNQELIQALEQLRQREEDLTKLNQELEETNRGVVALYAELDDKANSLKRANEIKTRFLSYTSHEFRTPLNSIISMSRLLLDRLDGELTPEQEKQINFMRQAAVGLLDMVNDLLDLAKVESGKIGVHLDYFHLSELFGTLRGLMRPLIPHNSSVSLVFDESPEIPILYTDQSKLAQILRNFISNALKYTEKGEVRLSATVSGDTITFCVADTGIGIAPEDQKRIFEDFTQLDSPIQKRFKGTGLGLPLSRKLAELLGGSIYLTSELGVGSKFFLNIPLVYSGIIEEPSTPQMPVNSASVTELGNNNHLNTESATGKQAKILLIDDDNNSRYLLKRVLGDYHFHILEASGGSEGIHLAQVEQPQVIFLDLTMPEMNGFEVLERLQNHPATGNIPVIVNTAQVIETQKLKRLEGRAIAILSKESASLEVERAKIRAALLQAGIVWEGT